MNKRQFLTASALLAATPLLAHATAKGAGPIVLTISGLIQKTNRPAFNPAFDQMFGKHKAKFERGHELSLAQLASLPQHQIKPTLVYDGKPHRLRGPLLRDVLALAGLAHGASRVQLQALDGYAVLVELSELMQYSYILAIEQDDRPLPLGGLGPVYTVFDPQTVASLRGKSLEEQFSRCPWGTYHIAVLPAAG